MIGYASVSYCRTRSLKMEFVLESWSNDVIHSANSISACEGCRTDRNSRPGYSIRCMCNVTARAVNMVQITAEQDVTTCSRTEIQMGLLLMKLCVTYTSLSGVKDELTLMLLMSYIYGAPSKARNANVLYIWTYVWQR